MHLTGQRTRRYRDMEVVKIQCSVCENQCAMEAEVTDGEVMDVMGNRCLKGFMYAQREVLNRLEAQKKGAAEGAQ